MPSLNELMKMAFTGQAQQPQAAALPPQALGSGMAAQAAQIMQSRPYQLHVQEARANGQEPMNPQEFAAQMQQPRR